jgi:hypothetical protein
MLVLKIIPLSLDWCTIYFALLFTRSINPDILMILSLLWRCATFPMVTKNIWHEWNNCKGFFKIMNFIGLYDLQETFRIILLNHSQSALQFLVYRCIIGKLWWFVMFFFFLQYFIMGFLLQCHKHKYTYVFNHAKLHNHSNMLYFFLLAVHSRI